MGLELELHSMRPARDWHASRATLLRGSYDLGNALADALGSLHLLGVPGRLAAIDPYRDTVMNEQEAAVALGEIPDLRKRCGDERRRAALDELALLLEACAATPGSHLWFQGD
ncbi:MULTISPECIES: hypothetical protein [Streptomyces]|uniref:hypothetical protein n=1 Tax=Streptomyces TaxID=1883 RepID=UPI000D52911F|nr:MULTISPECIES: hypothetical protein [Streptomyces]AWE51235.1 hypothetical protein DC008_17040 [Streptomyces nigra]MCF2537579.1 hypothetical protein [Streptomyces sp. FB2]